MSRNYMPANDKDYASWLANFVEVLGINASMVGVTEAEVAPLGTASTAFSGAYADHEKAKTAAKSACALKDTTRNASEELLRPMVRRIVNHPGMTEQLRTMLGLSRSDIVEAMTPIQALVPEVYLETKVGSVVVHFGPNPMNERQNGKPAGVKGANIYRKKEGESDYVLLALATSSPYYDTISGSAADYSYVVRYRGTKATDLSAPSPAETIAARGDLAA